MSNNVLMTLLWIGFILPIVIMVSFIKAHNEVIKIGETRLFIRLGVVAIVIGIVLTFFAAYTSLSGFGPGTILCSFTFVMGIITAFILFDRRSLKKEREITGDKTIKFLISLKLVLIFSQLMPVVGTGIFYNVCDSLHQQQAMPLIMAVESYYNQNNAYPSNLEVLVPEYIPEIPLPVCLQPYNWMGKFDRVGMETHYSMLVCGDKEVLAVSATTLAIVERYDFSNQTWSSADFLDGYCSDVE